MKKIKKQGFVNIIYIMLIIFLIICFAHIELWMLVSPLIIKYRSITSTMLELGPVAICL